MRLEAKGASGWRLRRGPVGSGKPQELTRPQPDIKDDPVGVMWALLCGARGQHTPEPNGSPMCRKSCTCAMPHANTQGCTDHRSAHQGFGSRESLGLRFRPAPKPPGLEGLPPAPAAGTLAVS